MGPMTKGTITPEGIKVEAMKPGELQFIQNLVLARTGASARNKGLIKDQTGGPKTKKKKGDKKKDGGDKGGGDTGGSETGGSETSGDTGGDTGGDDAGGESDFASEFEAGGLGGGGEGGGDEGGGPDIFTETAAEPSEETDEGCTS